ncbi:MAG TPA: hypothetical protein VGK23_12880 [Methanomassiliicoccales archaeon]|jgi:ppGpp synthetase/RelA/SpoT-type nucleotidyltranferase
MAVRLEQLDSGFDFEAHKRKAMEDYGKIRLLYLQFSNVVKHIMEKALAEKKVKVSSIETRAKSIQSFGEKAGESSKNNPNQPKYATPMKDINDMAGIRVIIFFPNDIKRVDDCIRTEFGVEKYVEHSSSKFQEEQGHFGYQSKHFIIRLKSRRTVLPEYRPYKDLRAEIQVRTVLQHAWAEIEHDIQYKSPTNIPEELKGRFSELAKVLNNADDEFQDIQKTDDILRTTARASVKLGDYDQVEITPDSLRTYLNKRFGSENTNIDIFYDQETDVLHYLGFSNLGQVEECIKGNDNDKISRLLNSGRLIDNQKVRFEDALIAAMGESYLKDHPLASKTFFQGDVKRKIKILKENNMVVGSYRPKNLDSEQDHLDQ